jgi:hypothetical protein
MQVKGSSSACWLRGDRQGNPGGLGKCSRSFSPSSRTGIEQPGRWLLQSERLNLHWIATEFWSQGILGLNRASEIVEAVDRIEGDTAMKATLLLLLPFLYGCIGDAAMPIVSTVRLPESRLEVTLHGPSRTGEYVYTLRTSDAWYNNRSLGQIQMSSTVTTLVAQERDGVYRVQWGDTDIAPFVLLDLKNRLILEDSNPDSMRNDPIKRAEYQ